METIDDIRREEGNPQFGPIGGKPRSIFSFFHGRSPRLVSVVLIFLGLIVLGTGAILFNAPLMIAGMVVLLLGAFGFFFSKPPERQSAL